MNLRTTAEEHKQLRRQLFIDTAVSLFSSLGYHETTVPMIVAESKTSTGSFYQHFRSKEDVLYEAIMDYGQRLATSTKELDISATNQRARLKHTIENLFLQLVHDPRGARLFLVETSGLSTRIRQVRNEILQVQIRNMQAHLVQNRRNLPDLDLWVISHCIVGSIYQSYCAWYDSIPNNNVPASVVANCISEFVLNAISDTR